jgi:hypothetical protein
MAEPESREWIIRDRGVAQGSPMRDSSPANRIVTVTRDGHVLLEEPTTAPELLHMLVVWVVTHAARSL